MRKAVAVIVLLLCALVGKAAPMQKTYQSAPMHEVLQDIEAHFGLSFMYRPADIAIAPAVTATIRTDDYQTALSQALGQSLQFTERKGIIIITPVPQKKETPKHPTPKPQPKVQTVVALPEPLPPIASMDTLPTNTTETIEREQLYYYAPIALLQPYPPFVVGHIDTLRIARSVRQAVINNQLSAISSLPAEMKSAKIKSTEVQPAKKKPQRYGPYMFHHAFQGTGRMGYGSELQAALDVRYTYFFMEHWGIGGGLNFTYGIQYAPDRNYNTIVEEGRVNLPIAVHTQWMYTDKWGLHASAGIEASFPATSNNISNGSADGIAIVSVFAAHPFSTHGIALIGIYTDISVTGVSPWSAGVQFGVRLGR